MLRQALDATTRPLRRLLLHTVQLDDPWKRQPHPVPLAIYGLGATHSFSWYLEGESRVDVACFRDVIGWLQQCLYVSDATLYHQSDFWQHPTVFERLRQGDCEDFALWAWRKLAELDYEVEFVAGRVRSETGALQGHAWVHLHLDARSYVLDAVLDTPPLMLRPMDTVRMEYLPEVSVDAQLQRYAYHGYYQQLLASS
ncbi:MAG: hypothetical protein AAF970_05050 [Bacteroidota bacterium]